MDTSNAVIGVFIQIPSSLNDHNIGNNTIGITNAFDTDKITAGSGTSSATIKLCTAKPNHRVKKVKP